MVSKLTEARHYSQLISTNGWKYLSEKIKKDAENVGLLSVYPGNVPDEARIRANERLRMINTIEKSASQLEELEDKFKNIK